MNGEVIEIKNAEVVEAINKSEIDVQIATAKQYPRDITRVLNEIETLATMDQETAEDCFYVLERGGSTIEGLSVRMTEIIAHAWTNLRIQKRIVANDGKMITAEGVCLDLERNVAICTQVSRRITDKYGKTYSADMQVMTGNAASSIAFRNAVLAVVPKAITKQVIERVKKVALGKSIDMQTGRQNVIKHFAQVGVKEAQLLEYLEVKNKDEIDKEMLFKLRGIANAIKEGTTTAKEAILMPIEEKKKEKKATQETNSAKSKVEAAMAQ